MSDIRRTEALALPRPVWLRSWIPIIVLTVLSGACTDPNTDDAARLGFLANDPTACAWTAGGQILVSTDPISCEGPVPKLEADVDAEFPRWNESGAAAAMVLNDDVVVVVIDGAEQGDKIQVGAVSFLVAGSSAGRPLVQVATREELLLECEAQPCGVEVRITRNGEPWSAWLIVPTASEMDRPIGFEFNGLITFESFEP